jgi:hypothetical protein
LNAEVEERRERRGEERREAGCKLIAGLGTRTEKLYERLKWDMH